MGTPAVGGAAGRGSGGRWLLRLHSRGQRQAMLLGIGVIVWQLGGNEALWTGERWVIRGMLGRKRKCTRASGRQVADVDQCQVSPAVSTSGSTPGPLSRTCLHGDSACGGSSLSLHPPARVCSCPGVLQSGDGIVAQSGHGGLSPQAGLRGGQCLPAPSDNQSRVCAKTPRGVRPFC